MAVLVPALKATPIPQWGFRVVHNETIRDFEVAIAHDDFMNDHIIIRDPDTAKEESEKAKARKVK